MSIATLPPSTHIKVIQTMLDKMRHHHNTAYGIPTRQELEHAQESLDALKAQINHQQRGPTT